MADVICTGVLDGRMAVINARYGKDVLHGVGIDGVDRGGKLASAIRRIETQILDRDYDLHDCD